MGIVDFTNPAARAWFAGHLRRLLAMGVDCFKTDFGERIPTEVVYHDGSEPERMHNHYAVIYNQTVFELLREVRGEGEAVLFARSAHTGGQKFPVHWGGDCNSTYESMAESLRGGLSLGLCGFGYWSHDIGGFEGMPDAGIYKRWIAFGLLSSHSRLHGSSSYRVPWLFDEEACDVLRFFTRLKCRLMPYLWGAAQEAHEQGVPMMRAMLLEFPEDPGCASLERQYMLGGSLLVAPVLSADGTVEFYLPPGCWTHLLTGEVRTGGWHRTRHGFLDLPLYVRAGAIVALGAGETEVDYDYAEDVTLMLARLADGAEARAEIPARSNEAATMVTARRMGDAINIELSGRVPKRWGVRLLPGEDVTGAAKDGARSLSLRVPEAWR
jgi:alpha-D-xyloside xylohydrolase